jgi:hypothetical protein
LPVPHVLLKAWAEAGEVKFEAAMAAAITKVETRIMRIMAVLLFFGQRFLSLRGRYGRQAGTIILGDPKRPFCFTERSDDPTCMQWKSDFGRINILCISSMHFVGTPHSVS